MYNKSYYTYMQRSSEKTLHFRKTLGHLIKQLRLTKTKLSGNKLANEYDIGNGNISRIQNGLVDCKFVTIWKISEALNMKFSDFAKMLEDELGDDFKLIDE